MDDIAALLQGLQDPTAEEKQAALARALSRQRAVGNLGLLTGDRVLAGFGQAQVAQAGQGEAGLMRAQDQASDNRRQTLQMALAAQAKAAAEKRQAEQDAAAAREREIDNARADRGQAVGMANAAATRALAQATLGLGQRRFAEEVGQHDKADANRLEAEVRELAKVVGDNPAQIRERLARLAPVVEGGGDVPGIGPLDSRLPNFASSDKAVATQADARGLVDILLNLQSGSGVSNEERENKYRQYGVAPGSTEAQFRAGMKSLKNDVGAALKVKQAGFSPDVIDLYKRRGGVTPDDFGPSVMTPDTKPKPRKMRLPNGEIVEVE